MSHLSIVVVVFLAVYFVIVAAMYQIPKAINLGKRTERDECSELDTRRCRLSFRRVSYHEYVLGDNSDSCRGGEAGHGGDVGGGAAVIFSSGSVAGDIGDMVGKKVCFVCGEGGNRKNSSLGRIGVQATAVSNSLCMFCCDTLRLIVPWRYKNSKFPNFAVIWLLVPLLRQLCASVVILDLLGATPEARRGVLCMCACVCSMWGWVSLFCARSTPLFVVGATPEAVMCKRCYT
jgi:hypothetical protein